jgi:hypothetical protein
MNTSSQHLLTETQSNPIPTHHSIMKTNTSSSTRRFRSIARPMLLAAGLAIASLSAANASTSFGSYKNYYVGNSMANASVTLRASGYPLTGTGYRTYADARATGKVFWYNKEFGKAYASATLNYLTKRAYINGYLRAFNQTIFSFNESFSTNDVFRTPGFFRNYNVSGPTVYISGVKVSTRATLHLITSGKTEINIRRNDSGSLPRIDIKSTPMLVATVSAGASGGALGTGVGVAGSLTLANVTADLRAKIDPAYSGTRVYASGSIYMPYRVGYGYIKPYVSVLGARVYGPTLISWSGRSGTVSGSAGGWIY